jgi:hypothetical protein
MQSVGLFYNSGFYNHIYNLSLKLSYHPYCEKTYSVI